MDLLGNSNWARLKGKLDTCKERIKEIKIRKFGESQRDRHGNYIFEVWT